MVQRFLRLQRRWLSFRESGQTLVEYSLILTFIGLVGVLGVIALNGSVQDLYDVVRQAANAMANAL